MCRQSSDGFAESFLFYHPMVWWITGIVREERENCCDDVVVAASGDVREYVTALTTLEQNRWVAREVALAANGGSLVKRVRRLLGLLPGREGFRSVLSPYLLVGILLFTGAMALTAWQTQAPPPNLNVSKVAWWQQWLDQDVVYIIQDQERNAFLNLATDEERRYFVDQFWQRRNPTPGTSENAFKNEHYRRLGFAGGCRFASRSGIPGWKTDRGRIYISFGPPDEIDSHPTGQALRYEYWSYRRIEGIGNNVNMRFADQDGSGEYHMTMDPNPSGAVQRVQGK
jgi:GWxTD domain-containing protein